MNETASRKKVGYAPILLLGLFFLLALLYFLPKLDFTNPVCVEISSQDRTSYYVTNNGQEVTLIFGKDEILRVKGIVSEKNAPGFYLIPKKHPEGPVLAKGPFEKCPAK